MFIFSEYVPDVMKIHIIGGFLGSGKTTLIITMAERYIEKGLKVAILENEAGEIGVDGAVLKNRGLDAVELTNGCICCTLTGTLQSTMRNIERDIDPDILIIEPTGLALPHKVAEMVKGKTVQEALQVTNKAVMEALDGLPQVKIHCSLLAEEAIHAALWDYAEKNNIKIEGLKRPKHDIYDKE